MASSKLHIQHPSFQSPSQALAQKIGLALAAVLVYLALARFQQQTALEGLLESSLNFRLALYAGYVFFVVLLLIFLLAFTPRWKKTENVFEQAMAQIGKAKNLLPMLIILSIGFYIYLLLGFYGRFFTGSFMRLALFMAVSWLIAIITYGWKQASFWKSFFLSTLLLAFIHNVTLFFQQVNTYPLSLGWSEISRYYQASFYFSERLYATDLALPITHPSRYLLQSLPFLISNAPLWLHRFWQALLWVLMAGASAWAFSRRLSLKRSWLASAFILWFYLYLMQGAVFYHLLPTVIIVLLSFDSKNLKRSLFFVVLASIWAGISRINWVPLPGALAMMLYLLEIPLNDKKIFSLGYWFKAASYLFVGSVSALVAYWIYIQNSGVADVGQFGSSFTSDLLWARLWPNEAFPLGILFGILVLSAPLLLIFLKNGERAKRVHRLRWMAISLILTVFFIGGLIVSVKIGGGTNLHNMDAYMVLLAVLTGQFVFGRFASQGKTRALPQIRIAWPHSIILVFIPVLFAVFSGGPLDLPDRDLAQQVIEQIQEEAKYSLDVGMEVLFISQRHLITFKVVEAPLVHDYEKLFLMEMAISRNDPYLLQFHEDLDNWRFGLIITDPLHRQIRTDDQDSLAAENNEWVRFVARPILCAYRPIQTYTELGIELLEPRYGSKCNQ